ncbi:MAG: aldo/keto reductase [Bacteroidales bacterium]|nr:aldo/keto reductase [Bacteroidales bacterium]
MSNINRRDFLKGLSLATAGAAMTAGGIDLRAQDAPQSAGKMEYRTSRTGDRVSLLGYGCMRMPTVDGTRNGAVDMDAQMRLIDYAIEHGVNYFDTAPVYTGGKSEGIMGQCLSRHPRDKYFIATKMSNAWGDFSFAASKKMYLNSFKELKTDYIDYYLLHAVGASIESFNQRFLENGLLEFLLKEREAGRIRNLGWSFHGTKECFDYVVSLHEKYNWDFAQIQHNYLDWNHASGRNVNSSYLYGELAGRDIPMTVMEPLRGGALANVPEKVSKKLLERRPTDSIARWAFRFAGSQPKILSVLSGMTYMEHLQDNIATYSNFEPCSEQELELLERIAREMVEFPLIECTGCNYCMPCKYGVDIPGEFAHYNKCVKEDLMPLSSGDKEYRKLRRAFLVGYDRSVPALAQASRCISCGECTSHCPQDIKIPAQMRRIDNFVENLKQGREF